MQAQPQPVTVLQLTAEGWTASNSSLDQCLKTANAPKYQYILVQHDIYSEGYELPAELVEYFQIQGHMLSDVYRLSNGFSYCDEVCGENGVLERHYTSLRLLTKLVSQTAPTISYVWHEMTFFTRWTSSSCVMLCIAASPFFKTQLQSALTHVWPRIPPKEPYALHVGVFEALIALQDKSVWSMRDILRNGEKNFLLPSSKGSDFRLLHEARRHVIHSMETLSVFVEALEGIQKQHQSLAPKLIASAIRGPHAVDRVQAYLDAQTRMFRNLWLRSQSNKERLQNEIGYGENTAVRRDSSAMRSIAVVTMAFLPPTFVSAIFSMSFFEYSPAEDNKPAQWSMSEKFWLYWAVAVPLAIMTMLVWYWREGNYYKFFGRRQFNR